MTLDGPSAAATLIEYARLRNVTRIVVGEPRRTGWHGILRPSTATKLVREASGIDVSVIAIRENLRREMPHDKHGVPQQIPWKRYWAGLAITIACSAVALPFTSRLELTNLVMIYLLGATIAALRLGRGPAIVTALANVFAFDFVSFRRASPSRSRICNI